MKSGNARQAAIAAVTNYVPIAKPLNFLETPAKEIFGSNVFNENGDEGPAAQARLQGAAGKRSSAARSSTPASPTPSPPR